SGGVGGDGRSPRLHDVLRTGVAGPDVEGAERVPNDDDRRDPEPRRVRSGFVGDGILGIFGAPGPDPDHAWHAVLCAVEMQAAMSWLGSRWERDGDTGLGFGIAVHTGEAFAGMLGSPQQQKYAVVGDLVNTAARMEKLSRILGTEVMMSGNTLSRVRDQ